jgi:hypothetical protein
MGASQEAIRIFLNFDDDLCEYRTQKEQWEIKYAANQRNHHNCRSRSVAVACEQVYSDAKSNQIHPQWAGSHCSSPVDWESLRNI